VEAGNKEQLRRLCVLEDTQVHSANHARSELTSITMGMEFAYHVRTNRQTHFMIKLRSHKRLVTISVLKGSKQSL
jgi:hypothetical protein